MEGSVMRRMMVAVMAGRVLARLMVMMVMIVVVVMMRRGRCG